MTAAASTATVASAESPLTQCHIKMQACHSMIEAFRATNDVMPSVSDSHSHQRDSGSCVIAVDNCTSCCMTNNMKDFTSPPPKTNTKIRGIGGSLQATCVGTVMWTTKDNDGVVHSWVIPNAVCNPQVPCCLPSPQHWAQEHDDMGQKEMGCITHSDAVELLWDKTGFARDVPLDPASDIALTRSASDHTMFKKFCADAAGCEDVLEEEELMAFPAMASDDEDEGSTSEDENEGSTFDGDNDGLPPPTNPMVRRHPDLPDIVFDWHNQDSEFC